MAADFENSIQARLSRLEYAVRGLGSIDSNVAAALRSSTSQINSHLEHLLSHGLREDAEPSLDPQLVELAASASNSQAYNDRLLYQSQNEQDQCIEEEERAPDVHCSSEMQDAVCQLHDALRSSWPKQCNPSHEAMLRLTATGRRRDTKRVGGNDAIDFDIMLSTHEHRQIWVENKFSVIASRSLRFVDQETCRVPDESQETIDVCQLIESSVAKMKYIRVSVISGSLRSQRPIMGARDFVNTRLRISLSSLVAGQQSKHIRNLIVQSQILSKKDKAIVAVILAYSLWHLSKDAWNQHVPTEGKWLQKEWNDANFYFLVSRRRTLDIGRPYLPAMFDNSYTPPGDSMHPSASIFAFAMTLISLQCHDLFMEVRLKILDEERLENPHLASEPLNMDYSTAIRLLETAEFKNNIELSYRKAIEACLMGDFVDNFWELDETQICMGFFRNVIAPLKKDLRDSWDLGPEDLYRPFEIPVPEELMGSKVIQDNYEPRSRSLSYKGDSELVAKASLVIREKNLCSDEICLFADGDQYQDIEKKHIEYADKWFERLKSRVHPLIEAVPGQQRVKVAILDTGIRLPDTANEAYDGQIECYKSWLSGGAGEETERGHRDLHGHGTFCASLILKVAKNASLHVARVFRTNKERNGYVETQATQEAIAQAIRFAVETWNVDIITMSFGCRDRVDSIHDAITEACQKKKLVFVAASNCGGNDRIAWPARMDKVICVHATDGNGNSTGFTPNAVANDSNFAVPGSGIKSFWPEELGGPTMRMNGTSCAAPIAAGIAAVVLDYVDRRKSRSSDWEKYNQVFDRIRERQGMSQVLAEMVKKDTVPRSSYKYLEPWELLNAEDKFYDEEDVLRKILKALNCI
ncbi:MAG: hypothetical protein M1820_009521 [Bogoriella megaspora]|nr:MAG: hypothetical protein M1820_009521 [Bogoriella megaspora]